MIDHLTDRIIAHILEIETKYQELETRKAELSKMIANSSNLLLDLRQEIESAQFYGENSIKIDQLERIISKNT